MHIQCVPIKNNLLGKINYVSYSTVTDFFTNFTALTEEVSGYIGSKFRYNICCYLKLPLFELKSAFLQVNQ